MKTMTGDVGGVGVELWSVAWRGGVVVFNPMWQRPSAHCSHRNLICMLFTVYTDILERAPHRIHTVPNSLPHFSPVKCAQRVWGSVLNSDSANENIGLSGRSWLLPARRSAGRSGGVIIPIAHRTKSASSAAEPHRCTLRGNMFER